MVWLGKSKEVNSRDIMLFSAITLSLIVYRPQDLQHCIYFQKYVLVIIGKIIIDNNSCNLLALFV